MVLQIIAGAAALAPTAMSIAQKGMKFATKTPIRSSFVQSSAFGAGYGAFTNVGYNLSNTYLTSGFRPERSYTRSSYTHQMPYGTRYSRYGRRYSSRYGRSRYGRSRYSRYGRRSYYGRRYY